MEKYIDPVNVHKEFFIFEHLLVKYHPDLSAMFRQLNIDTFFYATEWLPAFFLIICRFMTLFSSILPLPLFYRFFDVFLIEGVKTAYRCALTILEFKKKSIQPNDSFEDVLIFIKSIDDI
jgi:hypothetical protein